jgi:ubiquinone/menaquinone biosynthesis C-methylase UbiE
MLKEAKKLCTDACLIKADSSCLPFRPNSFDLVVFIFSLEFMANVARVFAETERVARKGIIIGLINKWSFTAKRRIIQSRTAANSYYKNARFYSLPEIRNILEKSLYRRFRILKWETTVFPLIFGNSQSKVFPFGSFLGIAIELDDEHV